MAENVYRHLRSKDNMQKMKTLMITIIQNRKPSLWTISGMTYKALCAHELTNKRIHRNLKSLWSIARKHLCKMNADCRNLHRKPAVISLCWEKTLDHKVTTQPRPGRTTLISVNSTQPTEHWVFPRRAGLTVSLLCYPSQEMSVGKREQRSWGKNEKLLLVWHYREI